METEAKFTIPDAAAFARLRQVEQFGPYSRRSTAVKPVHDRYLDTADRRFYQRQWFVRLRESQGALLLTLKGLGDAQGAVHSRVEIETPVPGPDLATWPEGEARRLVEEIAGDQPLADLFSLDQTRYVSILQQDEREVVELSLDAVTVQGPQGPLQTYELEAELLPGGTRSDLDWLVQLFSGEYHLIAQPQSKFERALALVEQAHSDRASAAPETDQTADALPPAAAKAKASKPPKVKTAKPPKVTTPKPPKPGPGVQPADSMGTAGRKVLRGQFAAMLAAAPGTRVGDDPVGVHDMRVATRRMRLTLRLIEPYLAERDDRRVAGDLRDVARALGAVRDLDVLIGHAQKFRDGLPGDQQGDLKSLLDEWTDQRDQDRTRLLDLLDSPRYGRFTEHMVAFLDETDTPPDQTAGAVPYQVCHVVGSAVWDHYAAVQAYETLMPAPTITQLHALRIAGKYLRYTLEFFREVLSAEAAGLIKIVVRMQDQLGAMHDADVAAGLIRSHLSRTAARHKRKHRQDAPPGLLAYLAEREAAVQTAVTGFMPTWEALDGPEWRARLAQLIAAV